MSPSLRWGQACALAMLVGAPAASTAAGPTPARSVAAAGLPATLQLAVGAQGAVAVKSRGTLEVDHAAIANALAAGVGNVGRSQEISRKEKSNYDLAATLNWRVVGEDERGFVVSARLSDVSYLVGGENDERQTMLSAPFVIHFDRSGRIRSYSFLKRYPEVLARSVRGIVDPLQMVLPQGHSAWGAEEQWAEGPQQFRYDFAGLDVARGVALVRKTKLASRNTSLTQSAWRGAEQIDTQIGRSEAEIEVDLTTGIVRAVRGVDSGATYAGRAMLSRHTGTFIAEAVEQSVQQLPATLSDALASLNDREFARARMYDVEPDMRPRVQGLKLDAVLAQSRTALRENAAVSHRMLRNYLRLHPENAHAYAESLDALGESEEAIQERTVGYAALASAGHLEAQDALVRVFSDKRFSPSSREQALISIMELEIPENFVVSAVWAFRSQVQPTNPEHLIQRSMATNVFGALGDVQRENVEVTDEVVSKLAQLAKSAGDDAREMVMALDGLSNVGDFVRVAPVAAPAFSSRDNRVRVAAFHTFRRMTGDGAFMAFAARYGAETDVEVIREATEVARQMPESTARNEWAKAQVRLTQDRDVITSLVAILGGGLETYPSNEATLRELLAQTTDRQVRREIYTYVAPAR